MVGPVVDVGTFTGRDIIVQFGLTATPASFRHRIQRFLQSYLGTPEAPIAFGVRTPEIAALNRWLSDPLAPANLLIAAEAGRGKTALIVRWLNQLDTDIPIAFFPISIRYQTNRPSIFYQALAARLAEILKEDLPPTATDPADFYKEKVIEYLDRFAETKERCLIVIDGLDEATGWNIDASVLPSYPIPRLRFVVSARFLTGDKDESGWLRRLGWDTSSDHTRYIPVHPLGREGIADVLVRTDTSLSGLAKNADVLKELERVTNGDPLLLTYYVEDLLKYSEDPTGLQPEQLQDREAGFGHYFEDWLAKQGGIYQEIGAAFDEQTIKAILAVLSCAIGALKLRDLAHLAKNIHACERIIARDTLEPLRRFVAGDGIDIGYSLGHPKLGKYLREDYFGGSDVIARTKTGFLEWGHKTIHALDSGTLDPVETPSYLLLFYGQHLREGADPMLFRDLVSNGWRLAWEADEEGEANSGFSHDVEEAFTALRKVIEMGKGRDFSLALTGCIRCALVNSSIATLSSNIEPELLLALVRERVRSPKWAIAYTERSQDSLDVAETLTALAPYVANIQKEAIALARSLDDPVRRAIAIAGLAPHISPDILHEALFAEFAIYRKTRLERLPGQEFINQDEAIASVLVDLAPYLPDQLVPDALSLLQEVHLLQARWRVLGALAPLLREDNRQSLISQELEIVEKLDLNPITRSEALIALSPHLSGMQRSHLLADAFNSIGQIDSRWNRATAIAALAPHLSQSELSGAVAMVRDIPNARYRAETLAHLAPYISPPGLANIVSEAIEEIRQSLNEAATLRDRNEFEAGQLEYSASDVLGRLGDYLDESNWYDAMAQAERIHDARTRAEALSVLAVHLSEEADRQALTAAFRAALAVDGGGWGCARALAAIPPQLPEELITQALISARSLEPVRARAVALSGISQHLPVSQRRSMLEEALVASRVIGDETERLLAINQLMREVSDDGQLIKEVAAAGYVLEDTFQDTGGQPESDVSSPAGTPSEIAQLEVNTESLSQFKSALEEMARRDPLMFPEKLISLAPHLPDALIDDAISTARTLKFDQERALLALAKRLDESRRLKIVEEIKEPIRAAPTSQRARLLTALIPHLTGTEQQDAVLDALATIKFDQLSLISTFAELAPFVASLPALQLYSQWADLLDLFSRAKRDEVVSCLGVSAPLLDALDGNDAIRSTILAIFTVAKWWP